jgi:hypothetical protein
MTYLDSRFSSNPKTRFVQADWSELILATSRTERAFRERGDHREADQVAIYCRVFAQYAKRHLDRIANGNGVRDGVRDGVRAKVNGSVHPEDKDSTHARERAHSGDVRLDSSALANETCACKGGGSYEDDNAGRADRLALGTVAAAVPSNAPTNITDVEGALQLEIDNLGELMAKHRDHQPYEVALKMLHRGRSLAREGKKHLAERQLRAARNTLGSAGPMEMR